MARCHGIAPYPHAGARPRSSACAAAGACSIACPRSTAGHPDV